MKHFIAAALCLCAVASTALSARRVPRPYEAYAVPSTLTLNIAHDEPVFIRYAAVLGLNSWFTGAARPGVNARARMLWDRNNLYVFYTSDEGDFSTATGEGQSVLSLIWPKGDYGELTLKPCRGRHPGKPVRSDIIAVHAGKAAFHALIDYASATKGKAEVISGDVDVDDGSAPPSEAGHIRVAVQRPPADERGTWKVEMKIPFTALRSINPHGAHPPEGTGLKKPYAGDVWRLQIVRYNRGRDAVRPRRGRVTEDASTPFPFRRIEWNTRWDYFGYIRFNGGVGPHGRRAR